MRTKPIESFLEIRKNIFHLTIVASIIALGVNLLAYSYIDYAAGWISLISATGLLLVFLGFMFFADTLLRKRASSELITGAILFSQKTQSVIEIPGYKFSLDLKEALNAIFLENKGLRHLWEKEIVSSGSAECGAIEMVRFQDENIHYFYPTELIEKERNENGVTSPRSLEHL